MKILPLQTHLFSHIPQRIRFSNQEISMVFVSNAIIESLSVRRQDLNLKRNTVDWCWEWHIFQVFLFFCILLSSGFTSSYSFFAIEMQFSRSWIYFSHIVIAILSPKGFFSEILFDFGAPFNTECNMCDYSLLFIFKSFTNTKKL